MSSQADNPNLVIRATYCAYCCLIFLHATVLIAVIAFNGATNPYIALGMLASAVAMSAYVSRYELRISAEKLLLHRPFHTDYEIELKNIESLEMGVREPQVVIWPRPASGLLPCKFAISAVLIPTKRDLHTLVQILEDKGIGHRFPPSGRGQYLKWLFFGRVSAHARDAFVTRRAALVMTLAGGASVIAGAWIYLGLLPKIASGRRADDVFLFAGLLVGFGLFRALRGARLLYAQLNRQEQ